MIPNGSAMCSLGIKSTALSNYKKVNKMNETSITDKPQIAYSECYRRPFVNSLSGGKTSSYMAEHYPADYNVFALVRIEFDYSKIFSLTQGQDVKLGSVRIKVDKKI